MSKSKIIHEVVHENDRKLNLHEIKAQTGAGSGHKHHNPIDSTVSDTKISKSHTTNTTKNINHYSINSNKIEKIYDVVTRIEGKANLHKIKAQTGAGNGYKSSASTGAESNTLLNENTKHKSHNIHAVFHNNDRKLNLHQIKAKTGAGSGYKTH